MTTTLTKSIMLRASRDDVWAYLTQPEKLALWFHAPKAPLVQGQPFEMIGAESGTLTIWGDVITARPPEYLEYTFTIRPMGEATSHVRWTLEAVAGGTRLSLEHAGLPDGAAAFDLIFSLDKGWEDHMARMRSDIHENNKD
ncbi:SRPBCC domain-containing protein [Sulfitobacter sp. F26204]|uniref:SRPBCC family protein n=1 Tax=Sulfitobacter sp. F26204 TaxID=2996014 RepID=UPI00225DE4CF|nr:SRPBCC domain-containing protein [Sulfitobacter sp. F26204]MCX7560870.1 SRPBCC domain-containing protein [Sulfitobacter sp. F26204]